ncbi:MAG: nuclear transport factor 2 family protein [Kofleriaceae bacterium]
MTTAEALARFRDFYDTFGEAWLPRLEEIYAPGFYVEDPFKKFDGDFGELRAYFTRVTKLKDSKFVVEDIASGSDGHYVRWTWTWKRAVPGVTHLRLDREGRVTYQRDIFDVVDSLPVLGRVIRAIKR